MTTLPKSNKVRTATVSIDKVTQDYTGHPVALTYGSFRYSLKTKKMLVKRIRSLYGRVSLL